MGRSIATYLLLALSCLALGCTPQTTESAVSDGNLGQPPNTPSPLRSPGESLPDPSMSSLGSVPIDSRDRQPPAHAVDRQSGSIPPVFDDQAGQPANASVQDQTSVMNSSYMTLRPTTSSDPQKLIEHLQKTDAAIGDLVRAGTSNIIEQAPYEEAGMRLAEMKLATGQQLANLSSATETQRKAGLVSQLEALSHLSSLGDVKSAKQLEELANSLSELRDPELSRQGRIVMIGFELQALENGISTQPDKLLSQAENLFQLPGDRTFPSFMMLREAHSRLQQLGFQDAAERMKETIVSEFLGSSDPQLRGEAWMYAARDTQALAAYNQASRGFGTAQFDSSKLLQAIRILYADLPYPATLEQLASAVANFEYGGEVELSQQVADFVAQEIEKLPEQSQTELTRKLLSQHRARIGLVGGPLELGQVVDFEGKPLDLSNYDGKVLLIDFWATWCLPCLKEIPNIRAAYESYADQGFDVIGINMDEDIQQANQFISQQDYPWTNYYFAGQPGFESDFAQRSGLTMIPFIVIVGPDGNVSRIHARGESLDGILRSLMGDGSD